ncbi:hypothetical protein MKW94_019085 [Papaver nudicaule]|uniref:ATP-dependent DNA helicase n=1 Tax=Papaver nudicaule TaxID=74823 RepID=A0AA41SCB2_PAPNU|nr:hypothetical protein [Papaver nudicaule]
MPDTDHWESFCRQQVLLKRHYRSVDEAKENFATWSECYTQLIRPIENPSIDLGMVEDELEDETHQEDEDLKEWMVAAAMAPNSRVLEDTDLGLRDIDVNHDWSQGLLDHPSIHEKKGFINTLRQTVQETHSVSGSGTSLVSLSRQQQVALDMVLESLRSESTIRLIISGGAGTGKELFGNKKSVRIMAPTGAAAFNIGGSTIHHELAITADKNLSYKKLEASKCRHMQVDFKDTKLIIIDEYSMIGRKMLANIDLRLRDIFSTSEPFGNVSIVLSLTLCLNTVFALNKYSDSQGLRSQNIEKRCRD